MVAVRGMGRSGNELEQGNMIQSKTRSSNIVIALAREMRAMASESGSRMMNYASKNLRQDQSE